MENRVLDSDNYEEMAEKIYKYFEVNQSCAINGWVVGEEDLWEKGFMVCEKLREFDRLENIKIPKSGRPSRRRRVIPDSIGGYLAHKIFKFKRVVNDNKPKWTIWRLQ